MLYVKIKILGFKTNVYVPTLSFEQTLIFCQFVSIFLNKILQMKVKPPWYTLLKHISLHLNKYLLNKWTDTIAIISFPLSFSVTQSCPTLGLHIPLFMGFSRQEYQSRLLFPFPGNLPDPGIKPGSPGLQVDSLPFEPPGKLCNTKNYGPKVKQSRI